MSVSPSELSAARDQLRGTDPNKLPGKNGSKDDRTEDVVKMYTDDERMKALAKETIQLEIGRGDQAKMLNLYPLTLRQVLIVLPKLKVALGPLMALFKERKPGDPPVPVPLIIDTLSEKMEEIPSLLADIFNKGNNVDAEWFSENLAFFIDMKRIVPAFLYINGFDKLWNLGKAAAPSPLSSKVDDASSSAKSDDQTQITESSAPSPSSAEGSTGRTTTS